MRRRRQKHAANHERWLVSYADFITLMFALFVVLFASSQADKKKEAQMSQAIHQAFKALGLFPSAPADPRATPANLPPVNVVLGDELAAAPEVKQDLERIQKDLEKRLSAQIAEHIIDLHLGREGLVISLREAGFYDSGSAVPHPSSMHSIDTIAAALMPAPYDIRIEGHTDNVPIHTAQFSSNWELSTTRATWLAEWLIVRKKFQPQRLAASGYAEFHPVAANDTPEGRGRNRRVDIIVLPKITQLSQDMTPAHP